MQALSPDDFRAARWPVALHDEEIQLWFVPRVAASEAAVRELLASYLGCAPATLPIPRGEHGKPYLAAPHRLEFNVSHTGQALLVGIARNQALGVDLESPRRARPAQALADRYFSAAEAAALRELDLAARQRAFIELWSCKEAVVKALGRGIGFGLARLSFALDAAGRATRLNVIDASAGTAAEWHIAPLQPSDDCVGALAWRGPERLIRAFLVQP